MSSDNLIVRHEGVNDESEASWKRGSEDLIMPPPEEPITTLRAFNWARFSLYYLAVLLSFASQLVGLIVINAT